MNSVPKLSSGWGKGQCGVLLGAAGLARPQEPAPGLACPERGLHGATGHQSQFLTFWWSLICVQASILSFVFFIFFTKGR